MGKFTREKFASAGPVETCRDLIEQALATSVGDNASAIVLDLIELPRPDYDEIADATVSEVGLQAQLAALEIIVYPTSTQLQKLNSQAQSGTLEVAAMEAPLTIFVWSKQRIMPVRLTEFSITEEAFDPNLNPIRAKVSLGMRVLNVNDTGFANKAGGLFMTYLQNKEQLARRSANAIFSALGITGV